MVVTTGFDSSGAGGCASILFPSYWHKCEQGHRVKKRLISYENEEGFICLDFRDMLMEGFLTTCHDTS